MALYKYKIMPQPKETLKRKRSNENETVFLEEGKSEEQGVDESIDGWIRKKSRNNTNSDRQQQPEFNDLVRRISKKHSMNSLDFWLELGFLPPALFGGKL